MAISLDLSQKQLLKLNTNMIQSLELMTLPLAELRERIESALEENPTLDVRDNSNVESYEEYASKMRKNEAHELSFSDSSAYGSDLSDNHQAWLEGTVSQDETLQEHLLMQLGCISLSDKVRIAAETIISNLNSQGFFSLPLSDVLTDTSEEDKESALKVLHTLDPAGIACSDFRESLYLQAIDMGLNGEELQAFHTLVFSALDEMKSGKVKEAAIKMQTTSEEALQLFSFLKTLTPYPGARFSSSFEGIIIPDLSIKREEGKIVLKMNDSTIPDIYIDEEYRQMAKDYSKGRDDEKDASKYLKKEILDGENLINQLELRRTTLEKVGRVLLEKQKGFFLFGRESLKPLTLQDVASLVGVHATTISRITTSKYVDTDYGIYPLKALFSSSVSSSSGEDLSKVAVKEMVKKIIEENSTGKKLSDQKISDLLQDKGITCARRTVSKYRKELGLDSSFER